MRTALCPLQNCKDTYSTVTVLLTASVAIWPLTNKNDWKEQWTPFSFLFLPEQSKEKVKKKNLLGKPQRNKAREHINWPQKLFRQFVFERKKNSLTNTEKSRRWGEYNFRISYHHIVIFFFPKSENCNRLYPNKNKCFYGTHRLNRTHYIGGIKSQL